MNRITTTRRASQLFILALVILMASPAFADRRTGLAGNRLFLDADDTFTYPQLVVEYKNLARFDYGPTTDSGNALAILRIGEEAAFGVALHRGDALNQQSIGANTEIAWLNNPTLPTVGGVLSADGGIGPLTVVDLMYGMKVGPGMFGLRFSFGNNAQLTEQDASDAQTNGNKTSYVTLNLGYSLRGDLALDSSLMFNWAGATTLVNGDDDQTSTAITVGLSNRGFVNMTDMVDLGFIADIGFSTASFTNLALDPDVTSSGTQFGLTLGAGPAHQINSDTRFAMYGLLGVQTQSVDPSDQTENDKNSTTAFLVPGVRMAFETALTRWLFVRTGAEYSWVTASNTQEVDGAPNQLSSGRAGGFGWNAGLGTRFGNFSFDAALNHGWITNGPSFLGAGGPMFLMASASYTW